MKATEVFFDQLEQEIMSGTFVKPQKEDAKLPPLPTKEGTPDTPDYTALRQMLAHYQANLKECNILISSQKDSIEDLIQKLESAELNHKESLRKKDEEYAAIIDELEDEVSSYKGALEIATNNEAIKDHSLEEKDALITKLSQSHEKLHSENQMAKQIIAQKIDENKKLEQQILDLTSTQNPLPANFDGIRKAVFLEFLTKLISEAMTKEKDSFLPIRELLLSFVSDEDWIPKDYITQIRKIKGESTKEQIDMVADLLVKAAAKGGIYISQFNMGNGTQGLLPDINNQRQLTK